MTSNAATHQRGLWTWPGPFYLYEFLIVAAIYFPLLHFFGKSGFAMAVFTALIVICGSLLYAALPTDLTAKDWSRLNRYTIWIIRAVALSVGYWLFVDTPAKLNRYGVVVLYTVVYAICESAAWHRKRIVEKNVPAHS